MVPHPRVAAASRTRVRAAPPALLAAGAVVVVCIAGVLTGCASRPGGVAELPEAARAGWTLTTLEDAEGTAHDPVPPPVLDLGVPGHVSGSDGCASVEGTIAVTPAPPAGGVPSATIGIRFSDLVSPSIGCTVTNGIEARYGAALDEVRLLTVDHDTLTLSGGRATLTYTRRTGTPTATPTTGPTPDATASSAADALPAGAQRAWALQSDSRLRIDLSTPGTIVVEAGCPSFTGDLTVTGRSAGGALEIRVTRRPDSSAHCLAITAGEQEFVSDVSSAGELHLGSTGLVLDGGGATLQFAPAN